MRGPVRIAVSGDLLPGIVAAAGFLLLVFGLQMALWLAVGLALCLYAGVWLLTRRTTAAVPETVRAMTLVQQIGERGFRIPNPEVRQRVSRICEQGSRFIQFLMENPTQGDAWAGIVRECLEGTLRIVDRYLELSRFFENPAKESVPEIDALLEQVAGTFADLRSRMIQEQTADLTAETQVLRGTLQAVHEVSQSQRIGG